MVLCVWNFSFIYISLKHKNTRCLSLMPSVLVYINHQFHLPVLSVRITVKVYCLMYLKSMKSIVNYKITNIYLNNYKDWDLKCYWIFWSHGFKQHERRLMFCYKIHKCYVHIGYFPWQAVALLTISTFGDLILGVIWSNLCEIILVLVLNIVA